MLICCVEFHKKMKKEAFFAIQYDINGYFCKSKKVFAMDYTMYDTLLQLPLFQGLGRNDIVPASFVCLGATLV